MKIKYFAWIKDITNKEFEIINQSCPKNIEDLKNYLNKSYPLLEKHISKNTFRYAVNMEYTSINLDLDNPKFLVCLENCAEANQSLIDMNKIINDNIIFSVLSDLS